MSSLKVSSILLMVLMVRGGERVEESGAGAERDLPLSLERERGWHLLLGLR